MEFDVEKIEFYIMKNLLSSDAYIRNFSNKLHCDLFSFGFKDLINSIIVYYKKAGKPPPYNILKDVVIPKICQNDKNRIENAIKTLNTTVAIDIVCEDVSKFMKEETQKFIKTRTIINAFVKCTDLIEQQKHDEVIKIMEEAFRINFDETLGLDYFLEFEDRLSRADQLKEVITTGIPSLDDLIGGGYRRKSFYVYAGPGNSGKSLILNDTASSLAMLGYNVLYLTLELSQDYISQRTDAKIADVPMNNVNIDPANAIKKAMAKCKLLRESGQKIGKLIYKEYAPNSVTCNDINSLIKNLQLKKDVIFDFIIVDYLKLIKASGKVYGDNMYSKLGTVCEEMRALAFDFNACVISASQTGRQSYNTNSIGMDDISDSIAIAQTADVLITILRTDELDAENWVKLNIAKSRFSRNKGSTTVKVDYEFMKLIDLDKNNRPIIKHDKHNKPDEHNKSSSGDEPHPDMIY